MNLKLVRTQRKFNGIFGELINSDNRIICITLEHAYFNGRSYEPKIPNGTYECVKGVHHLASVMGGFTTYEVTKVPNHTGILFHPGNFEKDSNGCILVGESRLDDILLGSKRAFEAFMKLCSNDPIFTLTVS